MSLHYLKPEQVLEFQNKLLNFFEKNKRSLPWRENHDPYRVWVSEVMLQQTQVIKVLEYYDKFLIKFPGIFHLASADLQDVLKSWEKMGYYARARNLHKAAQKVVQELNGLIPDRYDDFRKLPGVGDYIAAAVMSIAFNQPYPVVDGNVKRVLARLFLIEEPVNLPASKKIFQETAEALMNHQQPGDYNQAMMELGATICKPQHPKCHECPVSEFCRALESGRQAEFPVALQTAPIPEYHLVVGIVQHEERLLLTRRPLNGLLGGMWEFPDGEIESGEALKFACKRMIKEKTNLEVRVETPLTRVRHAYTHFKIVMEVFICRYISGTVQLNGPIDYRWLLPEELAQYPLTGANHKFLHLIKKKP
ncbi:A/G-specific adenine glycosylase [candidate division KSB1 bacterium]|nr:A/G-specific adenine glycosylase [candidate division KSB1 bacterium]